MLASEAKAHQDKRAEIVGKVAEVAGRTAVKDVHVESQVLRDARVPIFTREQIWHRMDWNPMWTGPNKDYPQCWAHDDLFLWFNSRDDFYRFLRYQEDVWWVEQFWLIPKHRVPKDNIEILRVVREKHIAPLAEEVSRLAGEEVNVESYLSMLDGHGWRRKEGEAPARRAAVKEAERRRKPWNPHKRRVKEEGKRVRELREKRWEREREEKKQAKAEMVVYERPKGARHPGLERETERERVRGKRKAKRRRLREVRQNLIRDIDLLKAKKFCALNNETESVVVPLTVEYTKAIQEEGGGLLNQRWVLQEGVFNESFLVFSGRWPSHSVEIKRKRSKRPIVRCYLCTRVGPQLYVQEDDGRWRCVKQDKCEDRVEFGTHDEREVPEPKKKKVVIRLERPAVDMTTPLPKKRHKEFKITETKGLKKKLEKITKGR